MRAASSDRRSVAPEIDAEAIEREAFVDAPHVRSVGGIEEYRLLANDLRVLYMPWRAAPVALVMLTYHVGSRHETPGIKGGSHMLEHLMFKGSDRFNKRSGTSIHDLLQPLGAITNATTWFDRTNYFDLAPCDHVALAAEIEADRMRHLRIDSNDLEAERSVVLNEHDMFASDPLERLNQAVWAAAFSRHPYGAPVVGARDDIAGLTRERLFEHYHAHYWPDNATMTVIGDLSRAQALDLASRHFATIPAGRRRYESLCAEEPEQREERRVTAMQSGQPGWTMLAYKSPEGAHPDTDALEVLGRILAGGACTRAEASLVAADLASNVWSSVSRLAHPGLFQVQAFLGEGGAHEAAERALRDTIDDIRRHGVSQDELDLAKGRIRGQCLSSRDGPVAIALQLNEAIAAGDWTAYPAAVERTAAVTAEDVRRVARRYLRDEGLTVGHLVDRASRAPTSCAMRTSPG